MKNNGNKLSEALGRMNRLVNHLESMEAQLGAIERDLLLQELRDIYALVISLPVADEMAAPEQEIQVEEEKVVEFVAAPAAEVEEKAEEVTEEVAEEVAEEEKAPFAPAEPEPEVIPAPEPVLDEIEGNNFDEVFEEIPEEEPIIEEPVVEETEPIVEEPVAEEPIVEEPAAIEEPAPAIETEPEPEPEPEPASEPAPEPEPVAEPAPEKPAKAKKEKAPEQPSLFDYLAPSAPSQYETSAAPTLADKIGAARPNLEEQLEHKANKNKVSDLRTVISINDKFSFMSELFRNNMKAYTDFILRLNAIESRDEALAACAEMAKKYEWAENSLAVSTFYKILDRKF